MGTGFNEWAQLVDRLGGDPVDCNDREYTADDVYMAANSLGKMEYAHGMYAILEILDEQLARRFVHSRNDHAAWVAEVKQAVKEWRASIKTAEEYHAEIMRPAIDPFTC